jgi:hypothetical protein
MTIKKLEKRVKEQQEQIDMLIELSNNMVERFALNQKEIENHRKAIEDLIHNSELDRTQIDSIQLASEYAWHGKPTDDSIIN